MERYRHLVGKRVEAHYRSGEFYLSCSGTLACDSGESIIVQEHFSSGGNQKAMRVEIPYPYIVRVEEASPEPLHVLPASPPASLKRR